MSKWGRRKNPHVFGHKTSSTKDLLIQDSGRVIIARSLSPEILPAHSTSYSLAPIYFLEIPLLLDPVAGLLLKYNSLVQYFDELGYRINSRLEDLSLRPLLSPDEDELDADFCTFVPLGYTGVWKAGRIWGEDQPFPDLAIPLRASKLFSGDFCQRSG